MESVGALGDGHLEVGGDAVTPAAQYELLELQRISGFVDRAKGLQELLQLLLQESFL